jgi:hypothetical protein
MLGHPEGTCPCWPLDFNQMRPISGLRLPEVWSNKFALFKVPKFVTIYSNSNRPVIDQVNMQNISISQWHNLEIENMKIPFITIQSWKHFGIMWQNISSENETRFLRGIKRWFKLEKYFCSFSFYIKVCDQFWVRFCAYCKLTLKF